MEKKLRRSQQRELIYQYLLSTKEHPSADMVYERLRRDNPNLSLGTVYRNLRLLESIGMLRRVTTLQNVERYDACCEDHAHFVCEKCGCVRDLAPLDMEEAAGRFGVEPGAQAHWVNVVFGGVCGDCAAAEEEKTG